MAILGLLKEQPMHGYDLRKRLRTDFGLLSTLSFGSLYPALNRLEAEGAVQEQQGETVAMPATEVVNLTGSLAGERAAFMARLASKTAARSHSGQRPGGSGTRARKIYELTPRGEVLFGRLLTDENQREDGKSFALRWAFAKHLSPDARLRLLNRRHRQLEDRLADANRAGESPARPLDRFERSLVEHTQEALKLDLDWIERLINNERAAGAAGSLTTISGGAELS
jgi:DNA-binding PadR family transcriptional regulator